MDYTILLSVVLPLVLTVGIVVAVIFLSRRMSNNIFNANSSTYLRMAGVPGEARLLSIKDTGKTLAGVYNIADVELEITSLEPHVNAKCEAAFLKSKMPVVGETVKVKYDPDNPKLVTVVV